MKQPATPKPCPGKAAQFGLPDDRCKQCARRIAGTAVSSQSINPGHCLVGGNAYFQIKKDDQ